MTEPENTLVHMLSKQWCLFLTPWRDWVSVEVDIWATVSTVALTVKINIEV